MVLAPEPVIKRTYMRLRYIIIGFASCMLCVPAPAQDAQKGRLPGGACPAVARDSVRFVPRIIPDMLPSELFIPNDRLTGLTVWMAAPVTRPEVHVVPRYGFSGYGFGSFTVDHWEKVFANLLGFNGMNVPQLIDSQQMMLGNTIALGKKRKFYFANGILYGRHYGVWGNMIGMGSREGFIYRPSDYLMFALWSQEYQSVYAYSPVLYPRPGQGSASMKLPASPVMVSYGAQAYFLAGQFWIGIGASFWHAADPEKH